MDMRDDTHDAEAIHEASVGLLSDPGVKLEHEEALRLALGAGARPAGDTGVVRLPREMVDEYVALCPSSVTLAARGATTRAVGPDSDPVFWSSPGMYMYRDGVRRPFTSTDMRDMARLLDRLEHVSVVFGMSLDDIPPPARDVVGLSIIARNTGKHARVLCFSPQGADAIVEMRYAVSDLPWLSIGFTAHGPLRWTNLALDIFRRTAGHGIPITVNGEPMAGASAPVTVAGAAAVGNAEILAGLVVNQLMEPGRPCIYNLGLAHTLDMRTAIAVTGGAENALFAQISAMMGRYYGLLSASWASTEAMTPDAQAGLEKAFAYQTHIASGVSAIWGVAQLESELTVSPAQAVIDNEIIGHAMRYRRGYDADDDDLALDVTRAVGIGGSFLDSDHTFARFRQELHEPHALWRDRHAAWVGAGSPTLERRAEDIADEHMRTPAEPHVDASQAAELDRIVNDTLSRL